MVTDCWIASVCVVPYPSSHELYVPVRAAWPWLAHWPMEPVVPLQEVAPDSKPGLSSFWPEQLPVGGFDVGGFVVVGGGVVPPVHVGSPDWAGTLTAFQAFLTALNSVQLLGYRFLAAVSVQVRYLRYDDDEVFISIAL